MSDLENEREMKRGKEREECRQSECKRDSEGTGNGGTLERKQKDNAIEGEQTARVRDEA